MATEKNILDGAQLNLSLGSPEGRRRVVTNVAQLFERVAYVIASHLDELQGIEEDEAVEFWRR